MRLNNGKCVDGDEKCVGPVYPLDDAAWEKMGRLHREHDDYYRCSECNTALQDAENEERDRRAFR